MADRFDDKPLDPHYSKTELEELNGEGKSFVGAAAGRRPGTIMVRSGSYVNPMDMKLEDIRLDDITHALSNICRFTGHCREFYSVAEHSVRGALEFLGQGDEHMARAFLLHDAGEYVLNDVARPLKYQPEMEFYRETEKRLSRLIECVFKLPQNSLALSEIKEMDNIMLATEARDLMGDPLWENMPTPLRRRIIEPWRPTEARRRFGALAHELGLK